MKTLRAVWIISAISICQFARSQSDVQILQATYGTESAQIDVTAEVQSLVQSGQTNVRVGNHLFDKDPAFGKVKTLSVSFASGGVQYRSDIREGDQLSLAPSNSSPLNTVSQSPPKPIPTTAVLAPERTYFLTASTHIYKKETGTLIGLRAGTAVQALRDDGATIHAKWENFEFDIDKRILTNDVGIANAAAGANYQAEMKSWNAQQQEYQRQIEAIQRRVAKPHRDYSEYATRGSHPIDLNDTAALPQRNWNALQRGQEESRRSNAKAEYEAKEQAENQRRLQQNALSAELKGLENVRDDETKHDKADVNLLREINAKRKLLNSLGGEP